MSIGPSHHRQRRTTGIALYIAVTVVVLAALSLITGCFIASHDSGASVGWTDSNVVSDTVVAVSVGPERQSVDPEIYRGDATTAVKPSLAGNVNRRRPQDYLGLKSRFRLECQPPEGGSSDFVIAVEIHYDLDPPKSLVG